MIEKGEKCTIWPDSQVEYEIIDVKSKSIIISVDDKTITETVYFVDLKETSGNALVTNVPICHINTLNN